MAGRKNQKSSKTDHVLNLISGMAAPAEEAAEKEKEPEKKQESPQAPPPAYSEHRSAPILEVARTNHEALSETIHQALEEEFQKEMEQQEETSAEPVVPAPTENLEVSAADRADTEKTAIEDPDEETEHETTEHTLSEAAESTVEPEPVAAPEPDVEPAPELEIASGSPETVSDSLPVSTDPESPYAELTDTEKQPDPVEEPPEEPDCLPSILKLPEGAVFVNVMQILVDEQIDRYMDMFRVCICPRCRADVRALALTQLPAKYIVLEKEKADPMMGLYRYRYSTPITVELTKACNTVMNAPHHKP